MSRSIKTIKKEIKKLKGELKVTAIELYKGHKLAVDRGGTIHLLSKQKPTYKDPWYRSLCGSPGDFNVLRHNTKEVSCKRCLELLNKGE